MTLGLRTTGFGRRAVIAGALALVLGYAGFAVAGFSRNDVVLARDTDTWRLWASAGHHLLIVEGDGTTDLDCYVRNRYRRLLGKDDDPTDYCVVDFWQSQSGDITVEIRNLGNIPNIYTITLE